MKSKAVLLMVIAGFLPIFACTNPIIEDFFKRDKARPTTPTQETPTQEPTPAVTYTVTFDSGGGSPVDSQFVAEGGKATRPKNPEKSGYGFVNWYDNGECAGDCYDFETPVTDDINLYAGWNETFYTVTFDSKGGSVIADQSVGENGTVSRPVPTKEGYTFDDWYSDPELNTAYDFATPVSGGITLYAKWTLKTYTVTFTDGETVLSALTKTVAHGSTVDRPAADPSKDGYTFDDWYSDSNLTVVYNFAAPVTGNITLYAKWEIVNPPYTLNYEMVWINPGTFQMGSPTGEKGRQSGNLERQHQVTLTRGFYMGKYQVTQAQYEAVMGTNPSSFKTPVSPETSTANRPVEMVSWYDAIVFCNKLSILESLSPAYRIKGSTNPAEWGDVPTEIDYTWNAVAIEANSTGYRLPTEAQWEYACRAGTTTAFNNGNNDYENTAQVGDVAWHGGNSENRTHEVGLKTPNAWGLYDMHGNVFERCWDQEGSNPSGAQTDPTGPGLGVTRAVRGGSWKAIGEWEPYWLRSAARIHGSEVYKNYECGFRLVRHHALAIDDEDFPGEAIHRIFGVPNITEWNEARNYISSGGNNKNYIINIIADFTIPGGASASTTATFGNASGIKVSLRGKGRTLTFTNKGNMLRTNAGQTLILRDLTLEGTQSNSVSLVHVADNFIMESGKICGNSSGTYGGGVFVDLGGIFTMNDGEISGNLTNYGGGVYVNMGGSFTMHGGVISGNSALDGGGVYVYRKGTFEMHSGKITGGNIATYSGAGVYVFGYDGPSFTMYGGEISGNNSAGSAGNNGGGGVYLDYGSVGTFRIVTGTIYGLNETNQGLRNYANFENPNSGAALLKNGGTAQYGKFNGTTWVKTADLNTTNNTIKVKDGVLQQEY